jgi:DNA-binding PadR family transcriptional regulator
MSPVFRHGGLRLYLLKLLDEAPRHGYEVIRLLQDRFLGVYAPSPGTIYPRLARLEEEGLVTHDEIDGKKVYRITEAGRDEIRARFDDLTELEDEITEAVRDIAREVTQDVRDTVRNLREELTWAARDVRNQSREQARDAARERARQSRDEVKESARRARDETTGARQQAARDDAAQADGAKEARGAAHADAGASGAASGGPGSDADAASAAREEHAAAGERSRRTGGGAAEWPERAAFQDWQNWAGWRERAGKQGWPGFGGFPGGAGRGRGGPWAGATRDSSARPDAGLFRDLERLAIDFARELRTAAWHTESVGENALGDLRAILEDTLSRVRDEVFGGAGAARSAGTATGPDESAETPGADDADAADGGADAAAADDAREGDQGGDCSGG